MDVAVWLRGLGLERYEAAFRDNEIDWDALPKLTTSTASASARVVRRSGRTTRGTSGPPTADPPKPSHKPEDHRELIFRFGGDLGVRALSIWAWALWHGGCPNQAIKAGHEALRQARQSVHLETLAYGLSYSCLTAVSARQAPEAEELANELAAFAREHGFAFLFGHGLIAQGWAMTQRLPGVAAVERIRDGLAATRADADAKPHPIDLVQERFDLAIMPVSPPDSTLVRRTLAKWHHVLCCAPAYLEKHPEPRSPADLAGHNCLLYAYTPFSDHWPFLDARGNTVIARVSTTLVTTSITVLRAAATAGLGLWLSPPFIVSDLLASTELVPLLRDYRLSEREIVALYPHRRHMTAKLRTFIDMLVDRFAEEHRWLDAASGR